jgi:xylan 1,4-beta-xylosidase
MGIASQLRDMDSAFKIVASFPELKNKPIIIGESDPDGCAACQGDQLGYRNGSIYASYTAASIAREFQLAARRGVNLEGALTWAFEFEGQPLFAGFRVLASGGVDLPVLNVFRMLGKMNGQRLAVESDGEVPLDDMLKHGVRLRPDVSALASLANNHLCVLVWHYHDDDLPGADAAVGLTLEGLPAKIRQAHFAQFRIDASHSNAFAAWKSMGSPLQPTAEQLAQLEKAGQLAELKSPEDLRVTNGQTRLKLDLPRQSVALVVVSWDARP